MAMSGAEATSAVFAELSSDAGSAPQADDTSTPESTTPESAAGTETTGTPTTQEQAATPQTPAVTGSEDDVPLTGNLPVARHKAILDRTRAQFDERLKKLSWAEKYADRDATEMQERLAALELAESNPVEFFNRYRQALAADPRYAALVQQQPEQPAQPAREEPMPQPDVELEDGRRLYSAEQQAALLDWQARKIAQRFAPIEQEFQGQKAWNEALERNRRVLEHARATWEGFKDNEVAIRDYMAKDGRATIESAYRNVVVPKLKADKASMEAEIRKSLLAELNSKAKASTEQPGKTVVTAPKSYKGMNTADIVAESFRELSGQ